AGVGPSRKIIKVAEGDESAGVGPSRKIIKVAEGDESAGVGPSRKIIKVAEGDESAGVGPSRKIIKVAEGDESAGVGPSRKIIKLAEGEELPIIEKRKIIVVAGGEPVQMEILSPEDTETRKVECVLVIRDVLGNQTKTKIDDLFEYAEKQIFNQKAKDVAPEWVDEF
ncbi:MAG: hypothetical protein HGA96_14050, partial [Desulfobulbaceae bacterium]|nr:hypothetical protein [Desulfobulbaceae bacterium]